MTLTFSLSLSLSYVHTCTHTGTHIRATTRNRGTYATEKLMSLYRTMAPRARFRVDPIDSSVRRILDTDFLFLFARLEVFERLLRGREKKLFDRRARSFIAREHGFSPEREMLREPRFQSLARHRNASRFIAGCRVAYFFIFFLSSSSSSTASKLRANRDLSRV